MSRIVRPARLITTVVSKRVGHAEMLERPKGAVCRVERNGGNLGEFLLWFRHRHYVKVDATKLMDTIEFTDGREQL